MAASPRNLRQHRIESGNRGTAADIRLTRVNNRGERLDAASTGECSRKDTKTIFQLAGEQVRKNCTQEMEGILARAGALSAKFPNETAFWELTPERTVRSQQLPVFLSTIAS